jgi:uncharacterized protein YkwD
MKADSIRAWLGGIAGVGAKPEPGRRARRAARPALDALEGRVVLSGRAAAMLHAGAPVIRGDAPSAVKSTASEVSVVTPTLENGVLVVRGTKNADTIDVTLSGSSIKVAGKSFSAASVSQIVVVGEDGNDRITVGESITKWTRLFGGAGNDTINGGGGVDNIYGGSGNDTLKGRGGNDVIYGGGGGGDSVDVGPGTGQTSDGGSPNRTTTMDAIEQEVVRLTNLERTKRGLAPLKASGKLAEAAQLHSDNMASRSGAIGNAAAHNHVLLSVTLPTPSSRVDYVGYDTWTSSFRRAENIAYGQKTAKEVVTAWMNSPGHKANILTPELAEIGVAYAKNAKGTMFWTQVFGKLA